MEKELRDKIIRSFETAFPYTPNIHGIVLEWLKSGFYFENKSIKENIHCFMYDYTAHDGLFQEPSMYGMNAGRGLVPQRWIWRCYETLGFYTDESNRSFATQEAAYNDMRRAALDKMKWNTEFKEDIIQFDGSTAEVGYKVLFAARYIKHESESGLYHYYLVPQYR